MNLPKVEVVVLAGGIAQVPSSGSIAATIPDGGKLSASPRLFRIGLVVLVLACGSQPAWAQEKSPGGQIYNELLPFVGLDGVRLEIFDLGTSIHSVLGGPLDPGNEGPGISHAEHVNLDKAIRADIEEAFRRANIPILPSTGSSKLVSPRLLVHIDVTRFASPDTIVVQIKAELLKAAHPLNNPEQIVWYSAWGNSLRSLSTMPQLAPFIQGGARGMVESFVRLYVRAHAR